MNRRSVGSGAATTALTGLGCAARGAAYDAGMSRTDQASRVIAATPERVYRAFVDPDALVRWLPPVGMTGRFDRFDARPGGSYRMVLSYQDASGAPGKATDDSDIVEARFVDLVPNVRVVQAVDFVSDDPSYAGTMTMTWELEPLPEGTRVTFRADDVPAGISAEDHAAGLTSSLVNLARQLRAEGFVPPGFSAPTSLVAERFRLEPLGPQHNAADHAAWTSSIDHIRSTPGYPDGSWPPVDGMPLDANLADLRRHAADFAAGRGFTFTVLDPADGDVIGCVYLYPMGSADHDVSVQSWVRASHAQLDVPLADAVAAWIATAWPWRNPYRYGR